MRLRDHSLTLLAEVRGNPADLRVLRKDLETGEGVFLELATSEIEIASSDEGNSVSFPISRLGNYLVVLQREWEEP